MNIGVVVDNEFDNDHRVKKEVKLLVEAGHNVHVLCLDFSDTHNSYSNYKVTRLKLHKGLKNCLVALSTTFNFYELFWKRHVRSFINKCHIEALHVHDLYLSRAVKKAILSSKCPNTMMVLDLHENYPAAINTYEWANKGIRKYIVQPKKWYSKEEEYLKYADKIIVLSHHFKTNILKRFPFLQAEAIYVHPNLPDINQLNTYPIKPIKFYSKYPVIFYFGVVAKRRGIIDILPWFTQLINEGYKMHLLIIGPVDKVDQHKFRLFSNNPILKKYLTYIPWININELPSYLKKVSIGIAPFHVNPQHNSGVANKIYQYMYGKIPILATKCKAQEELILNSKCGLRYNDYQSFASNLIKLLTNKQLRDMLGANGKKELLKLYNEKADKVFLKIYQQ